MSAAHDPLEQPAKGRAASWAWWAIISVAVLAVLGATASFLYPWLVAYGLLG